MDWDRKLERLESLSRRLEPPAEARAALGGAALAYAESFLVGLEGGRTFVRDEGHSSNLDAMPAEEPAAMGDLLEILAATVDNSQINPASGGHLGYIPGGGTYPSAIGDFLADVTNRYSGIRYASPGAVRMEQQLVRWMAGLVGYPGSAGGDLTSGGSTANLAAIVTAREAQGVRPRDVERSCVYLTRQAHHCVGKALRVAGLGDCPVRHVPMDRRHRMDADLLEEMVAADSASGLVPWLVVASAGTTDSGSVDPLLTIGDIAARRGMWFHVDAAYGGFFVLCEEGRAALRGLGRADSIVMDPHKGLFLPYGTGAVLVRDVEKLATAHSYQADYLQDALGGENAYSPAELSMELTRPFRGLRMWLPLRLFGLAPYRAALAEKIWLARYLHERLSSMDGFETGPYPDLSVVTFRYLPPHGNADAFNRRLLKAVLDDGRVFISSTMLDGHFTLRAAVLHFRTHRAEADHLLACLAASAARLEAESC